MLAPVLALLAAVVWSSTLSAQSSSSGQATETLPPPAIRRWVEVEQMQLAGRYRWTEATDGRVTASALQFQPLLRARMPIDGGGKLAVTVGAGAGSNFVAGWDNTGAGAGAFSGAFAVKQLFAVAAPLPSVEVSAGGLSLLRGEGTEITTYDNDGYMVGERVAWRHAGGPVAQVALTAGHLGDTREPSVFRRLDRLADWNYEQFLIGWRLGAFVTASTEYTHEGDRDTLREAMTIRLPRRAKVLTGLRLELYERVSPDTARGLNVAADLRPLRRLTMTAGVAAIDRNYGGLNADRFDRGTRMHCSGTYMLTGDLSLSWFWTEAFANDYVLTNQHRVDIVATINPLGTLRRHRMF